MRRHRVTPLRLRLLLLAVVLSGLFAMHGLGTGHQMPMSSAMNTHVMSVGHAEAMAPIAAAPLVPALGSYANAGGLTTQGGMGMGACVAILTAAVLLVALAAAARRRHDIDHVGARDTRSEGRPLRAPPKPGALTLAQLCVLRT